MYFLSNLRAAVHLESASSTYLRSLCRYKNFLDVTKRINKEYIPPGPRRKQFRGVPSIAIAIARASRSLLSILQYKTPIQRPMKGPVQFGHLEERFSTVVEFNSHKTPPGSALHHNVGTNSRKAEACCRARRRGYCSFETSETPAAWQARA